MQLLLLHDNFENYGRMIKNRCVILQQRYEIFLEGQFSSYLENILEIWGTIIGHFDVIFGERPNKWT